MRHLSGASLALVVAAAAGASEPRAIPRDEIPAALAPAVARGEAAMDAFRDRLAARLTEALREGGAVRAIEACRADARGIAAQVGEAHRVTLGRTAERLRNPANAPSAWARGLVEAASGKKAAEVKPQVVDLGDRIAVLRPIPLAPACTRCHGAPGELDPGVRAELAHAYPADRATGFAPGDLRGFMWVEVPKR